MRYGAGGSFMGAQSIQIGFKEAPSGARSRGDGGLVFNQFELSHGSESNTHLGSVQRDPSWRLTSSDNLSRGQRHPAQCSRKLSVSMGPPPAWVQIHVLLFWLTESGIRETLTPPFLFVFGGGGVDKIRSRTFEHMLVVAVVVG